MYLQKSVNNRSFAFSDIKRCKHLPGSGYNKRNFIFIGTNGGCFFRHGFSKSKVLDFKSLRRSGRETGTDNTQK